MGHWLQPPFDLVYPALHTHIDLAHSSLAAHGRARTHTCCWQLAPSQYPAHCIVSSKKMLPPDDASNAPSAVSGPIRSGRVPSGMPWIGVKVRWALSATSIWAACAINTTLAVEVCDTSSFLMLKGMKSSSTSDVWLDHFIVRACCGDVSKTA